ncbi:hypothetical protein ANAPRD1_00629 [Anaplasma phagocytophilum]|nr:hypothetical protein ANAPRD1_00629 [Anaplasma phagocytophilum]
MDAKDIIHTYAPTTNRQLVAAAIAEIVHKNPDINPTGVCGGLQSIYGMRWVLFSLCAFTSCLISLNLQLYMSIYARFAS